MEEGSKSKKTVFIGGISEDTDETILYESFSTFGVFIIHLSTTAFFVLVLIQARIGDIIEVQLPPPALTHHQQTHPTGNGALLFVFIPQHKPKRYV
jgi:peptidyl-prolyl isomerase E (cyclophilin E)